MSDNDRCREDGAASRRYSKVRIAICLNSSVTRGTSMHTATVLGRRKFVAGACAMSAASMLGAPARVAAEGPPEVPRIRLIHSPIICLAPLYIGEELLKMEGFEEVQYIPVENATE